MSTIQGTSSGGFEPKNSAKSSAGGSAGAGDAGGNLSGTSPSTTNALWGGRNSSPQAAGGIDQVANTIQQGLPSILIEAVTSSSNLINEVEDIYDRMLVVAQAYYEDFENDYLYWKNVYVPFLLEEFLPEVQAFEYYIGDGRGLFAPASPDRDLGRRGQMAAAYIKEIDIAWRTKRRITNQYARGEMQMDDIEASIRKYQAMIDQGITARRIEDIYEDEFNNRAWNRLLIAANIGLAGTNAASAGYSSAMGAYMGAMQDMANYKTALGNQISAAAGNITQRVFGG